MIRYRIYTHEMVTFVDADRLDYVNGAYLFYKNDVIIAGAPSTSLIYISEKNE